MAPALEDGDYAVARRLRKDEDVAVGTVIEIDHPDFGPIVKRVSEHRAGKLRLRGDALSSAQSEQIGEASRAQVKARLIWRISPKGLSRIV